MKIVIIYMLIYFYIHKVFFHFVSHGRCIVLNDAEGWQCNVIYMHMYSYGGW